MSDLYLGDCREVRSVIADNSIDTIITDPPYGLEFMGKGWDKGVPGVEFWAEFLKVTKPGGMLLAFGGTRTFHRMTCAIEDAGWEIRDCMMWLYGSGFPKSHDISKGIDKAKGAEREVIGVSSNDRPHSQVKGGKAFDRGLDSGQEHESLKLTAPSTALAKQWSGWGTALKPAWEPIIVAMKPLDGTFAENAEKHGMAGLNVDGGRIAHSGDRRSPLGADGKVHRTTGNAYGEHQESEGFDLSKGRWPANLILDEEAGKLLDEQSGIAKPKAARSGRRGGVNPAFMSKEAGDNIHQESEGYWPEDSGASRFFYCSKASKSERNAGCEELPDTLVAASNGAKAALARGETYDKSVTGINTIQRVKNSHPTVKPLKLMEYLCTLTKTPTGGVVLDPFAGSGTTLLAAKNTGREYIGIEQNPEYFEIIKARLGLK